MKNLDGKYSVKDNKIIKTLTGEPIPDDEPIFILRARDHIAVKLLFKYLHFCSNDICLEEHLDGIKDTINRFIEFAINHPERMKQPGITRGK